MCIYEKIWYRIKTSLSAASEEKLECKCMRNMAFNSKYLMCLSSEYWLSPCKIFKVIYLNYLETLSVNDVPLVCMGMSTVCDDFHRQPCSSALGSFGWACSPSLWHPCFWMCCGKCKYMIYGHIHKTICVFHPSGFCSSQTCKICKTGTSNVY